MSEAEFALDELTSPCTPICQELKTAVSLAMFNRLEIANLARPYVRARTFRTCMDKQELWL